MARKDFLGGEMNIRKYFLSVFKKAERKYGKSGKRLAAEGWSEDWQVLIATIMSAQSRDETTIPIAEKLFEKYDLKGLAEANYNDVLSVFKRLNYNKTKAKNVIAAAKFLAGMDGEVPSEINELVKIPGVGRKTANLILSEIHLKDAICVDTHVHRISNVLEFVRTKSPHETEKELEKIAPRKYWSKINRTFVLWGKEVPGRDRKRFLDALD